MARRNIFEILSDTFDLKYELQRIKRLFETERSVYDSNEMCYYSVRGYVEKHGFYKWGNRGRCVDVDDFLVSLGYEKLWDTAIDNIQDFFTLAEIIYNFCWIVKRESHSISVLIDLGDKKFFALLEKALDECLAHYNYKGKYFPEFEQLIIVEDSPEATAVAEIVDPEISYKVLRYNHFMLKGNLKAKKDILLALGLVLEPKRAQIKAIDAKLEDGIFYILNNLHLRHNNKTEGDKRFNQAVADMDDATLEYWYDELYQMMLLAYLQFDQVERNKNVKLLKQTITP